MSMRPIAALLVLSLLAAGCSDDEPVEAGAAGEPTADGLLTGTATVLESPEHGPQLCFGGVMASYPPQCGGPDVVGWDWATTDGEESANGTTWGEYTVVGTWADGAFTLAEPPRAPVATDDVPEPRSSTPCPEPEGGWVVVDASMTTQATQDAALAAARAAPDYSGGWVDQSINPAYADGEVTAEEELAMNDPMALILNARFTGDIARHEAELRALWGGALCVSEGRHTEAEMRQIQEELGQRDDVLWSGGDTLSQQVEIGVVVDDGLQAELDERYGEGVVDVQPALTPA
jgi:hypothetical protein